MVMNNESQTKPEFDKQVISSMRKYGKKIKKYQLIEVLKKEVACSELDVALSLERLLKKEQIKLKESDYYIISEFS